MDATLWLLQLLLAGSFVATGLIRFTQAREQRLKIAGGGFEDVPPRSLRASALIDISTAVVLIALATTSESLPALAAIVAACVVATTARLATTLNSSSSWNGSTASHAGRGSPEFIDHSVDGDQSAALPRIWRFDVLSDTRNEHTTQRTGSAVLR
jgi:hypothetical protein